LSYLVATLPGGRGANAIESINAQLRWAVNGLRPLSGRAGRPEQQGANSTSGVTAALRGAQSVVSQLNIPSNISIQCDRDSAMKLPVICRSSCLAASVSLIQGGHKAAQALDDQPFRQRDLKSRTGRSQRWEFLTARLR
jgi:hypothetical protein